MKHSVLLGFGPKQIKPFHTISNHVNVQVCAKLHIEISPPVTHVQFLSPGVAFCRFDKLGRSIIIRHIEPKPMWDGSGHTFTHAEWIPTHKVSTLAVRVIQCVEEKWCWWSQQIWYMLFHCIDVLALWILCHLYGPGTSPHCIIILVLGNIYNCRSRTHQLTNSINFV